MQLEIYSTMRYSRIRDDWARLYDLTPEVSPFLHPDAMHIAYRYFYPYYISRKTLPCFMVFKENGVARAIIPFLKHRSGRLQLFGNVNGFDESGFVYDSVNILPDIFSNIKGGDYNIEFVRINANSPISAYISADARPTSNAAIHFDSNFQEYISTLSKSVRQNIRTAYNRLANDGLHFDIKTYVGKDADFPINDIIDLYCRRHYQRYGVKTGRLKHWFLKTQSFATRYYRFSSNALTVVLNIHGRPAAFLSGLFNENRLVVPRLSIDSKYQRYSPGMLLCVETIKHLQSNTNIRTLDLAIGNESYKYQLGAVEYFTYRFLL